MLKKATILIIFLCLFLSISASATSYQYAGIYSEHRKYSEDFGNAEWYMMQAAAVLNDYVYNPTNPVIMSMDDGISFNDYALTYFGPQFLGRHLFIHAFIWWAPTSWGGPYPHPLDPIWSIPTSYSFSVNDGDGNPVSVDWTIPYTQPLAIPYISYSNPINHFFDWDDVAGADAYQLLIAPVDEYGNEILPEAFYTSGDLSDSEFTIGHLSSGEYAIWIQAKQLHPDYPGKFFNRSSYIYYYHVPTVSSIDEILSSYDYFVENEELVGDGPGNSANGRLNALRNMLERAGDLIDSGDIGGACGQLKAALKKCDGNRKPPDFVAGDAVFELQDMITELMESIECE